MSTREFNSSTSDPIDTFVAQNDACLLPTISVPDIRIEHLCRECGRNVDNIMSEVCGRRDCQQVAMAKAMFLHRLL